MSTYISFFLKYNVPNGAPAFVSIDDVSINYGLGSIFRNTAPYGKIKAVPFEKFDTYINLIDEDIAAFKNHIKKLNEQKEVIAKCNNDLSEKLEAFSEIDSEIEEMENDIDGYIYANDFLRVIAHIITSNEDGVIDRALYVGTEVGSNITMEDVTAE